MKTAKTKLLVDKTEWERIEATIRCEFSKAGISALYAARAVDIAASIIYDCRGSANYGRHGFNRPATHRSRDYFGKQFGKTTIARRCKQILLECGILLEDESWCNSNLDHPDGTWCISYAIDYNPKNPENFAVWFPSAASIIENAIARLRTVSTVLDYDTAHREKLHIDKAAIIDAARSGEIDADDFATFVSAFRRYPNLAACRKIGHANDKRIYTPLTMVKKDLLRFVKNEKGVSVKEIADIHSSFFFSILFANGNTPVFHKAVKDIYENRWYKAGDKDIQNTAKDLYNRILNHIETGDRATNLFADCASQKEKRDIVKRHCQAVIFASNAERRKWRTLKNRAFAEMREHKKVSPFVFALERAARIKCAIEDYFKAEAPHFWHIVESAGEIEDTITYTRGGKAVERRRTKKTPLFWKMTQGEEVLIALIRSQLASRFGMGGISTYRKHDAILACVETAPTEAQSDNTVGKILMGIEDCGALADAYDFVRRLHE